MKNKITKILGVLLTLSLTAGLLLTAVPVSAGVQSWTSMSTPSGTGLVVSDGSPNILAVGRMAYNSDKTAIYAVAVLSPGGYSIVKSTDSGRTWKALTIAPYTSGLPITDLMTSVTSANELYFTDGVDIYTSKNGGTSWTVLNNLHDFAVADTWTVIPTAPANLIVTLDMAVVGSDKFIFAGTANFGGADANNGVFAVKETDLAMPWTNFDFMSQRPDPGNWPVCNIWDVVIDPTNFGTNLGMFAVADNGAGTFISVKSMGNQWNQPVTCQDAEILDTNANSITDPYLAEIWLPSDFDSSLTSGKFQAWVSLATMTSGMGDVYIWTGGASQTIDLNIGGAATGTEVTDIDGVGTIATVQLIVGGYDDAVNTPQVWYSADGYAFTKNTKPPTGGNYWAYGADCTVLALDGFGTSGQALAGTGGYNPAWGGAAVSFTRDFAKTFNQISLMGTTVASLADLGGDLFLVTLNGFTGNYNVWQKVMIGTNMYWERITSTIMLGATPFLPLDVEQAPDGTLFIAEIGGLGIWRSFDNGGSWQMQFNDISSVGGGTISAWMPVSANSVLVGDGTTADTVYYTTTNGIIWTAATCSVGIVTDFATNGSTWYAVGDATKAASSTNNGATWTVAAGSAAPCTTAYIAVSSSGQIFVTRDNGGVYRQGNPWVQIDGNSYDGNGNVANGAGIVWGASVAPTNATEGSGVVYATDNNVGEGASRIRGLETQAEALDISGGVTLMGLWLTKDGTNNVLWSLGSDNKIWSYTDTLNKAGSGVSMVGGFVSTPFLPIIYGLDTGGLGTAFSATVKWNALTNAAGYVYYVSTVATDAALTDLYLAAGSLFSAYTTATQATIPAIGPNTTVYVSVWAVNPVSSFLFDAAPFSFTTPPAVPNWTPNLSPMSGAMNVQVGPTVFDWDDVVGATGYEFQIAEGNGIPSGTSTTTLTQSANSIDNLKNSTMYTWRVRSVAGTVFGDWVTSVFTTEPAAPTTPTPTYTTTTINIPSQTPAPTPTINLPQPTVVVNPAPITVTVPAGTTLPTPTLVLPESETPVYIWIIVAVGALLTIAVIVLIVRTRRVV